MVKVNFFAKVWVIVSLLIGTAHAERLVSLEVKPGVDAIADFWQGDDDKPVLIILHGFLQTREFPTVRRLATALADEGYSVLTPTLSLGLNRRGRSLPCEAIHIHSMGHDVSELSQWVDWVREHYDQPVALIGHSAGSVHILAYLSTHKDVPIEKAVLISLSYFGQGRAAYESPYMAKRAEMAIASGRMGLDEYSLAYCKKYLTTPDAFLSYYGWSKNHAKSVVHQLEVPTAIIVGGSDGRIDTSWLKELQSEGMDVVEVEGANHFFDQEHEFDLFDQVLENLD